MAILAAVAALYMFLFLFFTPPYAFNDDLSLFNPVYMFLHYGKAAYPAYNYFDAMFVHPPLHYAMLAGLMKAGLNLFHAERILIFSGFLLCVLLLLVSDFSIETKVGGLVSLLVAPYLQNISIRPETGLSYLWLAGLISLQAAANERWNIRKLLIGSACLSIASCLHYFAALSFLGIGVYCFAMFRNEERHLLKMKMAAALLPATVIAGGNLTFAFLPHFKDILGQLYAINNVHHVSSIAKHYLQYDFFFQGYEWLKMILIIPACVWASAIFLCRKETRLMALAAVPLTFYVWLFAKGKSAGYYLPEMLLLWMAAVSGLIFLAGRLVHKMSGYEKEASFLSFSPLIFVFGIHYFYTDNYTLSSYTWQNRSLSGIDCQQTLTRAYAKKVVGENARVGGRLDPWYTGGAAHWYSISQDLNSGDLPLPESSLHEYFSHFDALVENATISNATTRKDMQILDTWYIDDTLKLKGFVLNNNYCSKFNQQENVLSLLFYAADSVETVTGSLIMNDQEVTSFIQNDSNFNAYFFSMVTEVSTPLDSLYAHSLLCNRIFLPNKDAGAFQSVHEAKEILLWGVFSAEDYSRNMLFINAHGKLKDMISLITIDEKPDQVREMLSSVKKEPAIRFYKDYKSFVRKEAYY